MTSVFEEMVDAVVERDLDESAVVDHFFLIHYPYNQGIGRAEGEGDEARWELLRRFRRKGLSEVSPPGFKGTVKAMKRKHPEIDNPWALAWWQKKRGHRSHYQSKPPYKKKG